MDLSAEAEASRPPSAERARSTTWASCAFQERTSSPDSASSQRTEPSSHPTRIPESSGVNCKARTHPFTELLPSGSGWVGSQRKISPLYPADTIRFPSEEKAIAQTLVS